ncbi:hypothetical protein [Pseudoclavibacter sp. VKM Ac-2867]|uniref:hypothetical protein n=1 Tax=Pseudoclavibacter sp. VKM Ac-2867 TaxID=2783829 RepID=UPI00188BE6B1|nr:hypothetical protein [Pseudoclavibacter sp. VKM Ac-2867]MBF4459103.1 hypothetical protein [Pseudoclavibacter sp. VKM Ac-2867]
MTDHLINGVNESTTATAAAPATAAAVDPAAAAPETATPGATADAAATAVTGTGTSSVSTGTLSASVVTPAALDAESDAAPGSVQAGGFTMLGDAGIACEGDACVI